MKKDMPLLFPYKENRRAFGLADMAKATEIERLGRATYIQTLHVLEVVSAFQKSSEQKAAQAITSKLTREQPMVATGMMGILD